MKFPATYAPRHRGTMTQTHVRVWEIAKALGVESAVVIVALRQHEYDGMLSSSSSKVPLAWAVGVAHEIGGVAE